MGGDVRRRDGGGGVRVEVPEQERRDLARLLAAGTWGEPSEACAEAGMFAYETERVVLVRGEEMTPVMPKLEGSAVFSEVDCGRGARG